MAFLWCDFLGALESFDRGRCFQFLVPKKKAAVRHVAFFSRQKKGASSNRFICWRGVKERASVCVCVCVCVFVC